MAGAKRSLIRPPFLQAVHEGDCAAVERMLLQTLFLARGDMTDTAAILKIPAQRLHEITNVLELTSKVKRVREICRRRFALPDESGTYCVSEKSDEAKAKRALNMWEAKERSAAMRGEMVNTKASVARKRYDALRKNHVKEKHHAASNSSRVEHMDRADQRLGKDSSTRER